MTSEFLILPELISLGTETPTVFSKSCTTSFTILDSISSSEISDTDPTTSLIGIGIFELTVTTSSTVWSFSWAIIM